MTISWMGKIAKVSAWLAKNCGFFINTLFYNQSHFLLLTLYLIAGNKGGFLQGSSWLYFNFQQCTCSCSIYTPACIHIAYLIQIEMFLKWHIDNILLHQFYFIFILYSIRNQSSSSSFEMQIAMCIQSAIVTRLSAILFHKLISRT